MIQIQKVTDIEDFPLPSRATHGSAGYDLHAAIGAPFVIVPGAVEMIPTGYAWDIPDCHVGLLFPRSGLSSKEGMSLANAVGVIDPDYNGEVMAAVTCRGPQSLRIEPMQRFCQMVVVPCLSNEIELVESLRGSERGSGGFGSTGK